jgi:hypothetical protein
MKIGFRALAICTGKTIAIHNDLDLASQPTTRATNMLVSVIGDAGSMLVHADDGRIDHLHRRIMSCRPEHP